MDLVTSPKPSMVCFGTVQSMTMCPIGPDHTPGLCFFWSCQTFGQTTKYCHNYGHIPKKIHNVLAMPKTQKTCIVGTTPPMKSNPMACGLGWGHGHIVQWQCFACCMTCGMPMGACCGSHFGPNGGVGKPQNFTVCLATQIFLAANISAP